MKSNKALEKIGSEWENSELESFFRAYVNFEDNFRSIAKFDGLQKRNTTMCRNLFSLHESLLKEAFKTIEESNFDESVLNTQLNHFINTHNHLIAPRDDGVAPASSTTTKKNSTSTSKTTTPRASSKKSTNTTSSRKRKKPDTPTNPSSQQDALYAAALASSESRRSTRRSAHRKLTYNEDSMFKNVMQQNENADDDDEMVIDEEEDSSSPALTSPTTRQSAAKMKSPQKRTPSRRGRAVLGTHTPTTRSSPATRSSRSSKSSTPRSTPKRGATSSRRGRRGKAASTTTNSRRKSSNPQRIPRKSKSELQHLPYNLAPLPSDALPPNTPNGSIIKRDNFSRNSQLPLKLRKIGTHGTVPNVIKVQDLSGSTNEEIQNQIQHKAEQFGKFLASDARRFCACEWFYPTIDCGYFIKNEFMEELRKLNLNHVERMTRDEWNVVRSAMGTPRRFSNNFLESERQKLDTYRDCVRKFYHENEEEKPHLYIYPQQLKNNENVLVLHPQTGYVHHAKILKVKGNDSYHVEVLDDVQKSYQLTVPDTHVMQTGPIHMHVSKKGFGTASPGVFFSPGGNLFSSTNHGSANKRQRLTMNGDYREVAPHDDGKEEEMMPPQRQSAVQGEQQQSLLSPVRAHKTATTTTCTPPPAAAPITENGHHQTILRESPSTPLVGVNLFSQQSRTAPQLTLPQNLSHVDFRSMAATIFNLQRKKTLLEEINECVQMAEQHAQQYPEDRVRHTEHDYRIATLVMQLQEIDHQLQTSMDALPLSKNPASITDANSIATVGQSVAGEAPGGSQFKSTSKDTTTAAANSATATTTNDSLKSREAQQPQQSALHAESESHKRIQGVFQENRSEASRVINKIIEDLLDEDTQTRLGEADSQSMSSVRQLTADCVAFLMHVQSCIESKQFTAGDAELTLTAGLLALKPKGDQTAKQEAFIIYEEISQIVGQIQQILLGDALLEESES